MPLDSRLVEHPVLVLIDVATRRPTPISADFRAAVASFEGAAFEAPQPDGRGATR